MPLIVFEGLDFSGKSTQASRLAQYLEERKNKVSLIREPGGTLIGEHLRETLLDPSAHISDFAELFLFCASRAELCEKVIHPKLINGEFVIMDRFFESTLAYQGYGRGVKIKLLTDIHDEMFSKIGTYPDVTFFIDVPPDVCFNRVTRSTDRIESQGSKFYDKVYKGYQKIATTWNHVVVIEGQSSEDEIHKNIKRKLESLKII